MTCVFVAMFVREKCVPVCVNVGISLFLLQAIRRPLIFVCKEYTASMPEQVVVLHTDIPLFAFVRKGDIL